MATTTPDEGAFVFNIVWTGTVFDHLRPFVASQMGNSGARYRYIANNCPPEQVRALEADAEARDGRVVEVIEVSPEGKMLTHGQCLDIVRATRDDGDWFCFADADILARGPFLGPFAEALASAAGVTSGRGVWRDDDVIPEGQPGVSGEYFYSPSGYLFGSPHFAMYRRSALDETMDRWDIRFHSPGNDVSEAVTAKLHAAGLDYWIYDTAKIVNIMLQEDGNELRHFEHPALIHIGGLSHFFAPGGMRRRDDGELEPDWGVWRGMTDRFAVARFTADVLRALLAGEAPPELPPAFEGPMRDRVATVRTALVEVVGRFG